ncbi:MAG: hypothetical protein JW384_03386 [Nitrosomonadaceae bacterium]|nr:hypothetical protein [Nitrosomonadaceae bacterium]
MNRKERTLTTLSAIRFNPSQHQHASQIARASHMNLSTYVRIALQEKIDAYVASKTYSIRESYSNHPETEK